MNIYAELRSISNRQQKQNKAYVHTYLTKQIMPAADILTGYNNP